MKFRIQHTTPTRTRSRYFQDYDVEMGPADRMLLDALVRIKTVDDTLALAARAARACAARTR